MIRIIKLGNLIHENIEAKYIDENGNEIWNVPNDINELKNALKDTVDWITEKYIEQQLSNINENLSDISTEASYLEGILLSLGADINTVKTEIAKVIMGQETIDQAISNLQLTVDQTDYLQRAIEIAKIITWKETIWRAEENLETQIDSYASIDDLINLDLYQLCNSTYESITQNYLT